VGTKAIAFPLIGNEWVVASNIAIRPHPKSLSQRERDFNLAPLLLGEKGLGDEGRMAISTPNAPLALITTVRTQQFSPFFCNAPKTIPSPFF